MYKHRIELTTSAVTAYSRIQEAAVKCIQVGDVGNSRVSLLRTADELLDDVLPLDPFETSTRLTGPLMNIFQVSRENLRFFYAASPRKPRVIVVLHISDSPRKNVPLKQVADEVLNKLLLSGQFDHLLRQYQTIGTRAPN